MCLLLTCRFSISLCQCNVVAPGELDAEAEDDSVCLVAASSRKVLHFDYHVLYSGSYGTPVLYFRVCTLGESLTFITSFSALHCLSQRLSPSHVCFGASSFISDVAAWMQCGLASGAACTLYNQCYYSYMYHKHTADNQPINWYLKSANLQPEASAS